MLIDIGSLHCEPFIKFPSADGESDKVCLDEPGKAFSSRQPRSKLPLNLAADFHVAHKNSNDFPSLQMFVQNTFQIEMHYSVGLLMHFSFRQLRRLS